MIPNHSQYQDTAKEFLLYLTSNYQQATNESEYYNFPAWPSLVPELTAGGRSGSTTIPTAPSRPTSSPCSRPPNDWTVNLGWPGPANAAIGEVFGSFILPNMMARAARGEQTAAEVGRRGRSAGHPDLRQVALRRPHRRRIVAAQAGRRADGQARHA